MVTDKRKVDIADLGLEIMPYESWLEIGGGREKAEAIIQVYGKPQLYARVDGTSNKLHRLTTDEDIKDALEDYHMPGCPLDRLYTGNKYHYQDRPYGCRLESFGGVIVDALADDFAHVLFEFNKKNLSKAGLTEEAFTNGDYNEEIYDHWEYREYPHKLVESFTAEEILKILDVNIEDE